MQSYLISDANNYHQTDVNQYGFNRQFNCKILVSKGDYQVMITLIDIVCARSEGNYTTLYLRDGESIMTTKSLKYYSDLFVKQGFYRPNRSELININHICSIYKKETIILVNNQKVQVSKRNKTTFLELLETLKIPA